MRVKRTHRRLRCGFVQRLSTEKPRFVPFLACFPHISPNLRGFPPNTAGFQRGLETEQRPSLLLHTRQQRRIESIHQGRGEAETPDYLAGEILFE